MWYFSDVEFAGESESAIRMEKFQVVRELETEMSYHSEVIGNKGRTHTPKVVT